MEQELEFETLRNAFGALDDANLLTLSEFVALDKESVSSLLNRVNNIKIRGQLAKLRADAITKTLQGKLVQYVVKFACPNVLYLSGLEYFSCWLK
jgi:hypothetical protein